MSEKTPQQFDDVSVMCKANVYFGGGVVSHTVLFKDGRKKTLGLIYPGTYTFKTDAPELMALVSGACRVRLSGEDDWKGYAAGNSFRVPAHSSFDIAVDRGFAPPEQAIAEYICSFE